LRTFHTKRVSKLFEKFRKVSKSFEKFRKVSKSFEKFRKVSKSFEKFRKVSKSSEKFRKVLRSLMTPGWGSARRRGHSWTDGCQVRSLDCCPVFLLIPVPGRSSLHYDNMSSCVVTPDSRRERRSGALVSKVRHIVETNACAGYGRRMLAIEAADLGPEINIWVCSNIPDTDIAEPTEGPLWDVKLRVFKSMMQIELRFHQTLFAEALRSNGGGHL